jgi:hypothetical protein
VHIVDSGTVVGMTYRVKYRAKPDSSTIVEPGKYDVLFKSSGGGTFILTDNVEVKERRFGSTPLRSSATSRLSL